MGDGYCLAARLEGPDEGPMLCGLPPGHDGEHEVRNPDSTLLWRWANTIGRRSLLGITPPEGP